MGMISGRRMDNPVEGERGWGTAMESVYEVCFTLFRLWTGIIMVIVGGGGSVIKLIFLVLLAVFNAWFQACFQ